MKEKSKAKVKNKSTDRHISTEELMNVVAKLLEFLHQILLFPERFSARRPAAMIDFFVVFFGISTKLS
jgi:hypothetical protein